MSTRKQTGLFATILLLAPLVPVGGPTAGRPAADAIIDSANLQLYLESSGGLDPVDLNVYYVTSAWTESAVTWNTMWTAGCVETMM